MDALLFSANAVLPIILLILLGWLLKKVKILNGDFLRIGNKLTFNVFLPLSLFYNIYNIPSVKDINWYFILYAVVALFVIFGIGFGIVLLFTKDRAQRGVLIQATFRSNYAIIGLPLAQALFGAEGAAAASLLSAFSIPIFNILAVITLSIFNGNPVEEDKRTTAKKVVLGIVKNPLIISVVAGIAVLGIRALLEYAEVSFRMSDIQFLYTVIKYLAAVATPFALIVLGGQFEFSAVKRLWKPIVFGTVIRTVAVPLVALTVAYFLIPSLQGQHFASYIALFGTPVSVSSAIMAKEMGGDDELAGQLVVWTSIAAALTLFVTITIFRALAVF